MKSVPVPCLLAHSRMTIVNSVCVYKHSFVCAYSPNALWLSAPWMAFFVGIWSLTPFLLRIANLWGFVCFIWDRVSYSPCWLPRFATELRMTLNWSSWLYLSCVGIIGVHCQACLYIYDFCSFADWSGDNKNFNSRKKEMRKPIAVCLSFPEIHH